jgi:hypothetical protein
MLLMVFLRRASYVLSFKNFKYFSKCQMNSTPNNNSLIFFKESKMCFINCLLYMHLNFKGSSTCSEHVGGGASIDAWMKIA